MPQTILIVEDDAALSQYLRELLSDSGYSAQIARDGANAINKVAHLQPDLVLLDLGLPNIAGESVCTELRKKYPELPIIILTAKDSSTDIVKGLNLGANDYMPKPFIADELLARIKVQLRRQKGDDILKIADLTLNKKTIEVKRGSKHITVTPHEFKLLEYLMQNKGNILSRDQLLTRIWSSSPDIETRVVDVYMGYLRKKVDEGFNKKLLFTSRGFGYYIKE